jgi:wyosine [tRNA(Phe)-imidazoG37] synthetase (radical SAM superfamily)
MRKKVRKVNEGVIYGPVKSRRFGNSLGINISGPGKYCSFNCIYCFRGFNEGNIEKNKNSFFNKDQVIDAIDEYFKYNNLKNIDDITIAGNGEPTDNSQLPDIIDHLYNIRNEEYPEIKLTLLTNGMGFIPRINPDTDRLLKCMDKFNQVCIKLDSANPETWKKITNPAYKVEFSEWFESIKKIQGPVIQTMLMNGKINNIADDEIDLLIKHYKKLKPVKIHLITINKAPADSGIMPVPEDKLEIINQKIQQEIFP